MKKILTIILFVCLICGLTACSKNEINTENTGNVENTGTTEGETTVEVNGDTDTADEIFNKMDSTDDWLIPGMSEEDYKVLFDKYPEWQANGFKREYQKAQYMNINSNGTYIVGTEKTRPEAEDSIYDQGTWSYESTTTITFHSKNLGDITCYVIPGDRGYGKNLYLWTPDGVENPRDPEEEIVYYEDGSRGCKFCDYCDIFRAATSEVYKETTNN